MWDRYRQQFGIIRDVLFYTKATHDAAFLYISNILTAGIGFIASIIIARQLGPAEFAIITAYNSIVMTLTGFTDFGLGTGLIKFVAPQLKAKQGTPTGALPYFKFVFYAEIVIGSFLLIAGLVFSNWTAGLFKDLSPNVVRLAVLSASITSTTAYVNAALSAYKKFKTSALLSGMVSILRLSFILLLLQFSALSIPIILSGYVVLAILSAIVGFGVIPKDYLAKVSRDKVARAGKAVFKFSGWLTLSFVLTSIMGRLDFFYLYKLRGTEAAGIYAAALQLSMIYSLFVGAVSTVLTPHISEKNTHEEQVRFLKKGIPLALLGALAVMLSALLAPTVINVIFGNRYSEAITPLQILIGSYAINILLIPVSLMFVPLGKVQVGTAITLIQLAFVFIIYPILIPAFGASGAAATVVLSALLGLIGYPMMLSHYIRRRTDG